MKVRACRSPHLSFATLAASSCPCPRFVARDKVGFRRKFLKSQCQTPSCRYIVRDSQVSIRRKSLMVKSRSHQNWKVRGEASRE